MAKLTKRQKALRPRSTARSSTASMRPLRLVKQNATAKFDETVEVALNLGVDPRHADQMVRGVVNLPKGTGKTSASRCSPRAPRPTKPSAAGADMVGAEDLMEDRSRAASIDFDRVIATPDMMGVVGRLGKVLGPKGLMPNPKLGTVTMDVTKAVTDAKSGQVEFRVEKAGIVHAGIGKASFSEADLKENFRAFMDAIVKAQAVGRQGQVRPEAVASARRWARASRSTSKRSRAPDTLRSGFECGWQARKRRFPAVFVNLQSLDRGADPI